MAFADSVRDLIANAENNGGRWFFVALGVVILLRLKLVLFAAALPLMAYWHYSNQESAPAEADDVQDEPAASAPAAQARRPVDDDSPWPWEDDDEGENKEKLDKEDPYDQAFWGPNDPEPMTMRPSTARSDEAAKNGHERSEMGPAMSSATSTDSRRRIEGVAWGDLESEKSPKPGGVDTDGLSDMFPTSSGVSSQGRRAPKDDFDDMGLGGSLGSLGSLGFGNKDSQSSQNNPLDDFDFLGGGKLGDDLLGGSLTLGDDFDFLGGGFGGGKGKGKGKGKNKDGKGKDPNAPREADPKQVFVANVGDMDEDEIRDLFGPVGSIERLKVLRTPEGASKGVCFVTFSCVEEAEKALQMHGQPIDERMHGRNLVVRMAHGGGPKGEKGDKGGGKDRDRDRDPLTNFDSSERFGAVSSGDRDRDRPKGKGKKGGKGGRGEVDEILEEVTAENDGPLRAGDFDFAAKRFLGELRTRDRSDGTQRMQEALDMVIKYTNSKDRDSVRNWRAYVFTLLQKFDTGLWEELRERDAERRREKGGGGRHRDD